MDRAFARSSFLAGTAAVALTTGIARAQTAPANGVPFVFVVPGGLYESSAPVIPASFDARDMLDPALR